MINQGSESSGDTMHIGALWYLKFALSKFGLMTIIFGSALKTAVRCQGFPRDSLSARFDYSEDEKSFVWIVTDIRGTEPDNPLVIIGKGTYKHIEMNATTGSVVKIYKETIIL
jgi:hypothetical protein